MERGTAQGGIEGGIKDQGGRDQEGLGGMGWDGSGIREAVIRDLGRIEGRIKEGCVRENQKGRDQGAGMEGSWIRAGGISEYGARESVSGFSEWASKGSKVKEDVVIKGSAREGEPGLDQRISERGHRGPGVQHQGSATRVGG